MKFNIKKAWKNRAENAKQNTIIEKDMYRR